MRDEHVWGRCTDCGELRCLHCGVHLPRYQWPNLVRNGLAKAKLRPPRKTLREAPRGR